MSENLTKVDVASELARIRNIPAYRAEHLVSDVLLAMINTIESTKSNVPDGKNVRGKLTLLGFGVFETRNVEGKEYSNPQNRNEKHFKPEHNKIIFRTGRALDEAINNSE